MSEGKKRKQEKGEIKRDKLPIDLIINRCHAPGLELNSEDQSPSCQAIPP